MFVKDEIIDLIKPLIKNSRVFLVGGYIRNYFIDNKISKDRDLVALDDSFELANKIAKELNATLIELDKENKIYRVVLKDKQNYFDISQALENDIYKDAQRRDFTINSIFYDLNKEEFYDPFLGIKDIENKLIKTANLQNLKDDPLRFLRLYRFLSLTGFEIEKELLTFAKNNFKLIENVAKERINTEIINIFEGKYVVETLLKMYEDEVLEFVFPFVKEIKRVPSNSHHHLDLIHHSIETVKQVRTDKALLKIACFYHDIGKPKTWTIEPKGRHRFIGHDIVGSKIAVNELENLKFSKKQIAYITKMIRFHIYPASLIHSADNKKAFARFVKKLGKDSLDVIELSRADRLSAKGEDVSEEMIDTALKHLNNLADYYKEVAAMAENPSSLLDGFEIMKILNIKPSKKLGEIIEQLKIAQLSKEVNTKEEAIIFIKNLA